ncbi:MAG: glycosyltransferase family 2 protein [Oscillospiraceae bacterium]|nr:glycosyltransferase family 2 protein [Oscillospiraceae bacterium]
MYSLILVDYNSLDATISYIDKCRNALGIVGASHIVIVENGSNEHAVARLQAVYGSCQTLEKEGISQPLYLFTQEDCQIVYCYSGDNLGYAKGNNLGAQIAQTLWADPYYIVSNNDLYFEGEFDLQIAEALFDAHPEIGVIGPQVTTPAGQVQSPRRWISAYRRLVIPIQLYSLGSILPKKFYNKLKDRFCEDLCPDAVTGPCGWVSGCFMLLRASAFHEAEMFDPYTFLYAEEPILSRRMERAGYSVWFCRELSVIHNHAQTTRNALSRLRIVELDFGAMCYYYKTYTDASGFVLWLAKCNFAIFKWAHPLWNQLKSLFKKKSDQ